MIPIDREFILLLFSVNNDQLDLLDSHENFDHTGDYERHFRRKLLLEH